MNAMPRIGAMMVTLLLPFAATAEPIELKLSFYTSAQTDTYRYVVKPFVDGVNAEAKGLLAIKVFPGGALGKALAAAGASACRMAVVASTSAPINIGNRR